jgi:hypothetical protein
MSAIANRTAAPARFRGLRHAAALAFWVATAAAAAEAPPVDRSEWESGWHVVRPGDTLEGLAARFLGSSGLWRELHTLNPFVRDPDLLFPGQRLRIFLERPTAKLSAQVMAVARDVRELPTPVPWRAANEGDVLLERDALRTAASSSARLRFDDGDTVTLSEDSLVFIRRQNRQPTAAAALPRKEIEIEIGQADIEGVPANSPAAARPGRREGDAAAGAIEVVVAGARSLATSEGGRPLSTRSRRAAGDTAQFMVFAGKSTVSAAGATVDLPAGSGTSVPSKSKPGPAETLLPAPTGLLPADEEELATGAPRVAWSAVAGAAHYTVEVCRDAVCGELVDRIPGIEPTSLDLPTPSQELTGTLYWRVTAVAPSGLDGFPSPAQRFSGVDAPRLVPPAVALVTAAGDPIAAGSCLAAAPELVVQAVDRRGAPLPWQLLLDGRESDLEGFRRAALAGPHAVAARVTDARGRTADSPAVAFTVDAAAPWVDLVASSGGPAPEAQTSEKRRWFRKKKEPVLVPACDSGLEARDASGGWSAIPCSAGAPPSPAVTRLDPARPSVELRTTGAPLLLGGMPAAPGEPLRLDSWDVGCGGSEIGLRILPSPFRAGRMLLEVEVVDAAGNRRTQGWHVQRR